MRGVVKASEADKSAFRGLCDIPTILSIRIIGPQRIQTLISSNALIRPKSERTHPLIPQRLNKCLLRIRIEQNTNLRRHIIRQFIEMSSGGNRDEQGSCTFLNS
jgi:hypothetical protein